MFSPRLRRALAGTLTPGTMAVGLVGAGAMALSSLALRWLLEDALPIGGFRLALTALGMYGVSHLVNRVAEAMVNRQLAVKASQEALGTLEGALWKRFRSGFQSLIAAGPGRAGLEISSAARAAGGLHQVAGQLWGVLGMAIASVGALLLLAGPMGLLPSLAPLAATAAMVPFVIRGVAARRRLIGSRDRARAEFLGLASETTANLLTVRTLPDRSEFGEQLAAAAVQQRSLDHNLGLLDAEMKLRFGLLRAVMFGAALFSFGFLPEMGPGAAVAGAIALGSLVGISESVASLLMQAADVEEAFEVLKGEVAPPADKRPDPGPIRRLEAQGVWFQYPDGPWVLEDVNLVVEAGQVTFVNWPSGKGKSTLLRILSGALVPTRGQVLVNGEPLSYFDVEAFRLRLGVLTQAADLLSGSIYQALEPVLPPGGGEEAAWGLLEQVEAAAFTREMPLGLHTWLLQGGAGLSGGQQRRIALARALAPGRDLFLLDEPLAGTGESHAWLVEKLAGRGALICSHEHGPQGGPN